MNIPEIVQVPTAKVVLNTGQVEGLPANPRQWTAGDVERLARSIAETPELFAARPILAVEHGGHYVALGGNLRLTAARKNRDRTVPVIVYPADTPLDTLRAIVIKDNGSFGQWDFDALANTWDDLPLTDWGVPAWEGEAAAEQEEAQEDDFDEDADEIHVRCKPGDIWQLGDHRLMCGDSIDLEQIKKLMGGQRLT